MHHDGGTIATYRAMIESLDLNVALILKALRRTVARRDTLAFTSDNGGERR